MDQLVLGIKSNKVQYHYLKANKRSKMSLRNKKVIILAIKDFTWFCQKRISNSKIKSADR